MPLTGHIGHFLRLIETANTSKPLAIRYLLNVSRLTDPLAFTLDFVMTEELELSIIRNRMVHIFSVRER